MDGFSLSQLRQRESGQTPSRLLQRKLRNQRLLSLELQTLKIVDGDDDLLPVSQLDIEQAEDRYLLVGYGDGGIKIYDLETDGPGVSHSVPLGYQRHHSVPSNAKLVLPLSSVPRIGQSNSNDIDVPGHRYLVSTVQWYPHDSGMFVTSSLDKTVKVWDTNAMTVVCGFAFEEKVYSCKMGIAKQHCLIAAGLMTPNIRLCDITSGASSHTLIGHRDAVLTIAWSPSNEFQFVSGSRDKTIRLWDIRRSGATACLLVLDQDNAAAASLSSTVGPDTSCASPEFEEVRGDGEYNSRRRLKRRKVKESESFTGPHAMASLSTASSHNGPVLALAYTPTGDFILSSGKDNKIRLWDACTGKHQLVNYLGSRTANTNGSTMCVLQEGAASTCMLFHPNGEKGDIFVYPVHSATGRPLRKFQGHYGRVTGLAYRYHTQELISGGADGLILVWAPPSLSTAEVSGQCREETRESAQQDAWSSEEEEYVPPILNRPHLV